MHLHTILAAGWLAASTAYAGLSSPSTQACAGNTPQTRDQWCDFDIHTDYYTQAPDTGVVREYWLELGNTTAAPDGIPRDVLTINGTSPGPTIYANWGDWVRFHVYNGLENNGTSIHWHNVRQNHTNPQDVTNSITQCPTPPGRSITYEWRATQYGTTYYHSHFALQAWDGIYGAIVINGPASSNYDVDAGSYRLRLVNGGMSNLFRFMIDDHNLTVIAADFVPIEPYNTTSLNIGVGQRYDVIVTANQAHAGSDFWMRAIPQEACAEIENTEIKGIFHYEQPNIVVATPTTTAYNYTDSCYDEPLSSMVPVVAIDASGVGFTSHNEANVIMNSAGLYKWYMGPTTFKAEWDNPTLLQIAHGNTSWTKTSHVVEVEGNGKWVIVDIEMTINVPHPIHLHGHDFFILAQGDGSYTSNTTLNTYNPPRRDTAMLPALGYLVIAFKTDNPGAWLLHCHIGWHQSEGFAMQFVESMSQLEPMIDPSALEKNCAAWDKYAAANSIEEEDSGIYSE
ncbi:multicopper oxidase [Aspergillus neoniger CBS 115656]|uniref:laccase n=1 Tax=Aspergillus neoniger (strain CBS 115656) TaxID=1448310 RepID=A0A318Z041_ASPNB|nr:multicopper oxidase [Aspergillus neoniger CBS 115656]PYH37300.1 multicopper oxidase [Aspergillus neoniger CBS 115656]